MVLVVVELQNGKIKKTSRDAVVYGGKLAQIKGIECAVIALGKAENTELEQLGGYGIKQVLHADDERLNNVYSKAYTKVICEAANQISSKIIVLPHTTMGRTIAPRVAVRLKAALIPAVTSLPDENNIVRRNVFSGKAFAFYELNHDKVVLTLNQNPHKVTPNVNKAVVKPINISFEEKDFDYKIISTVDETPGHVPLPEAEIVVSGGRGMKGPENWGMLEELANVLGAATACSRPVADIGWRPHHEHVGQTGITIKPNLYIAVGISGAIQHLAGVNQSKVIVAINKDSEAPMFKAANYGVIGDALEVLPRLTEAIKKLKASHR
jgi:electron transfer flavoprotein alpha subunit